MQQVTLGIDISCFQVDAGHSWGITMCSLTVGAAAVPAALANLKKRGLFSKDCTAPHNSPFMLLACLSATCSMSADAKLTYLMQCPI